MQFSGDKFEMKKFEDFLDIMSKFDLFCPFIQRRINRLNRAKRYKNVRIYDVMVRGFSLKFLQWVC